MTMEMPDYLNYGKIMEMNPVAQQMAWDQMDMAKMFKQQQFEQERANLEGTTLKNTYERGTLADRMNTPRLQNEGLVQTTRKNKLDNDLTEATYPQAVQAKIAEYARTKSDSELKVIEDRIQRDLMSEDPVIQGKATKAWEMSQAVRMEREKSRLKTEEAAAQHKNRLAEIDRTTAGQEKVAKIRAEAKTSATNRRAPRTAAEAMMYQAHDRLEAGLITPDEYYELLNGIREAELSARNQAGVTFVPGPDGKLIPQAKPPASKLPPMPGTTPTPEPAKPVEASREVFQKAWPGEFDAQKYEYRIGPDGKPQRRKK